METYLLLINFLIAVIIISVVLFMPEIRNKSICKGIKNTDKNMKNHLFLVDNEQEVIDKLENLNCQKRMKFAINKHTFKYTFDKDKLNIEFYRYGLCVAFHLSFVSKGEKLFLKVERLTHNITHEPYMPYCLNELFIDKINAEPVEYETL